MGKRMVAADGGQSGAVKPDEPFRVEVLEALSELYLRLNGYFCIRNYLQHLTEGFGLDTESDLLAVRLPYQEEVLQDGRRQPNDMSLVLPAALGMIDCLIVEVKEPSVEFNRPLRGAQGSERILALLRMFGAFGSEAFHEDGAAKSIATDLHARIRSENWAEYPSSSSTEHRTSVRMLVFAPDGAKHAQARKHVDLQRVLDVTRDRMRPEQRCVVYRGPAFSPWRGSMHSIVEALDQSWSPVDVDLPLERFIENAVALLKTR